MSPDEFLRTIYLGDRRCMRLELNGDARTVRIQVDRISRIRGSTWDYYDQEDVVDGYLVFDGVQMLSLEPPGPLPNDFIELISAEPMPGGCGLFRVSFDLGTTSGVAGTQSLILTLVTRSVYLEDPLLPGQRIVE